jgi:hypothetical protein
MKMDTEWGNGTEQAKEAVNRAPHPQMSFYGEGVRAGSLPLVVVALFEAHDLKFPFRSTIPTSCI